MHIDKHVDAVLVVVGGVVLLGRGGGVVARVHMNWFFNGRGFDQGDIGGGDRGGGVKAANPETEEAHEQ